MHRRPDSLRPRRCAGTPFTIAASLALTVGLLGSATAAHAAEVPQASPTPAASATAQHPALKATAVGELVLKPGEKPKVGTEVKWTITITNTGDVPLDDVAYVLIGDHLDLQPGQTSELTTSSTLDQNDLANGHTAVDIPVSGKNPDGARIEAPLTGRLTLPTPQSAPTTPASVPTTPATMSATPIPAPAVPVRMHTPGTPAVVVPAASGTTS